MVYCCCLPLVEHVELYEGGNRLVCMLKIKVDWRRDAQAAMSK